MVVRQLAARVQRWQLLGRYYANKWHYDGTKWAERVWYGERSSAASVASVPFMITRNMRAQLEGAGFPPHAIAALSPQAAHQLLADKLSYAQFVAQQQQQQKEVAAAAARAAEAIKREASSDDAHVPTQALVVVTADANSEQQRAEAAVAPTVALVLHDERKKEA
ncbi:hypothetical protein PybrP1_001072 [[Pythium] brassicae (nom. inval.)]|nr:hypothetical protein PybrP1_001072 [[Pythium] brassicae (nom. inval.)]